MRLRRVLDRHESPPPTALIAESVAATPVSWSQARVGKVQRALRLGGILVGPVASGHRVADSRGSVERSDDRPDQT